jgi:hypothetical protein
MRNSMNGFSYPIIILMNSFKGDSRYDIYRKWCINEKLLLRKIQKNLRLQDMDIEGQDNPFFKVKINDEVIGMGSKGLMMLKEEL